MLFGQVLTSLVGVVGVAARSVDVHIEIGNDVMQPLHGSGDVGTEARCYWSGTSPFCAGSCDRGYTDCGTSSCGDGACCVTGYKKYCCLGSSCSLSHGLSASLPPTAEIEKEVIQVPEVPEVPQDDGDVRADARCYWSGTSPFCAGSCDRGYTDCGTSSCGDGACCVTGYKKYCCLGSSCSLSQKLTGGASLRPSTSGGDNDDLCEDNEFICCKPGAKKNKDCKCIPRSKAPHKLNLSPQRSLDGGDLCSPQQTLCCNPDAEENSACACIDE